MMTIGFSSDTTTLLKTEPNTSKALNYRPNQPMNLMLLC